MKINVAMRIVGGFAVLSILLLVLGFFSLFSLNSVGDASHEVSTVAMPAVAKTSDLKVSFVNMGRLAFESIVSDDKNKVNANKDEVLESRNRFEENYQLLTGIVANDDALRQSVEGLGTLYEEYIQISDKMFDAHLNSLIAAENGLSMLENMEMNVDDAATLLLDFTDLDEISESSNLQAAANLADPLESSMLSLMRSVYDFNNSQTLQRADIRSKEVTLLLDQVNSNLAGLVSAANGEDSSGTIEEVQDLVQQVNSEIKSNSGLIASTVSKLEQIQVAQNALSASDIKITEAIVDLQALNQLTDVKANEIKEQVDASISSSNMIVIGGILFCFLIAGGVGYVTVIAITRPLDRVNELLKIAASGDLTHRLDDSACDEFGTLAKNCNFLINSLKDLIHSINQRADQLASASGETSTITLQTTASIEDQKAQLSEVAGATTEMHATSKAVSANANDTLKEIKHADAEAEKVKQISIENKRTIEALALEVQQAADVINKLHQDSASIGSILDVIRGIADQTNLLALNAAIEAARAGEQGRGFAVVADEVRTLASRTQQSTQEINSMIEVLQAGAETAVSVMNQGKEQTHVCVTQTENAGAALSLITDAVHRAYEVSTRIEQAASEQDSVSLQISEKLESIVEIAEHNTIGAKQTSESSSEVARLAEELQNSISQFKVA